MNNNDNIYRLSSEPFYSLISDDFDKNKESDCVSESEEVP